MGAVAGMQNPVLASYVNRRIPSERRATMLSVQSVVGSFILGIVQPVGGLMADGLGLQGMFLVFGVLTITLAPAILMLWNRAETAELATADAAVKPVEPERSREPVAVS